MADQIIQNIHIHHNILSSSLFEEDDLLADDLDDLIAEVNDNNPSLKDFSQKKYKHNADNFGNHQNHICQENSPLRIWEDTATEGDDDEDQQQSEENLLDIDDLTSYQVNHNNNRGHTNEFQQQNKSNIHGYSYPQHQQQSNKAILVLQEIRPEQQQQQSCPRRLLNEKIFDGKENVNPNVNLNSNQKSQKMNLNEKRHLNEINQKENLNIKGRKEQKIIEKNVMRLDRISENIRTENVRRNNILKSNTKMNVNSSYPIQISRNSRGMSYSDTQRNNNNNLNNNSNNNQQQNNNPFSNPQSIQPSSSSSTSSSYPSSFMDGCVRRLSKLELEKIKFQAQLEEERKKQISSLSSQVFKFDF